MACYTRILIDLDGPLANSKPQTLATFSLLAQNLQVLLDEELLRELCAYGRTFDECCAALFPNYAREQIFSIIQAQRTKFDKALKLITPVPALSEILQDLRYNHQAQIAVVTNRKESTDSLEIVLARAKLSIGDNIDIVVAVRDNLRPKPAPDLFYAALQQLGVRKNSKSDLRSCLVIEDGINGLIAVQGLLATCAITWGWATELELQKQKPTHIARTPQDLQRIILGR